jgi:hypothetical protein
MARKCVEWKMWGLIEDGRLECVDFFFLSSSEAPARDRIQNQWFRHLTWIVWVMVGDSC